MKSIQSHLFEYCGLNLRVLVGFLGPTNAHLLLNHVLGSKNHLRNTFGRLGSNVFVFSLKLLDEKRVLVAPYTLLMGFRINMLNEEVSTSR